MVRTKAKGAWSALCAKPMSAGGIALCQLRWARSGLRAALLTFAALIGAALPAVAQNATWNGATTDWNTDTNWTPNTVPLGTATFTNSGSATVDNNSGIVIVGAIDFTGAPNAQAYTINIDNPFIVNAAGVTNSSTNTQTFNIADGNSLVFQNSSTANNGTGPVTYNDGATVGGGAFIYFENSSNAGNANTTVVVDGFAEFSNTSSAGSAAFTNNGQMDFFDSTTAANANITNASGGTITFNNNATAGTSTITMTGTATTTFNNSSTAGSAIFELSGMSVLTFNNSSSAGTAQINPTEMLGGAVNFNNTSTAANSNIQLFEQTLTFSNTSTAGGAIISMPDPRFPGAIVFQNSSTAGNATITVIGSTGTGEGTLQFLNTSTAANATIANNSGLGAGGTTEFGTLGGTDTSNAGSAMITNNSNGTTDFFASTSASSATITNNSGGNTNFQDQSTAANAIIINNNGGTTNFGIPIVGTDTSTAGNASITNDNGGTTKFNALTTAGNALITTLSGGSVIFGDKSTGGNAQFITNGTGFVDFSGTSGPAGTHQISAGSIAGSGNYFLGSNALTVGSNNLSTTVSGVISDGGTSGGTGASLIKIGTGTLTLTGANIYTGATTIDGGTLVVNGSITSSAVTVNSGGTLSGTGTIDPVVVTIASGATFAPGTIGTPGTSTMVAGNLAFQSGALYVIYLNPSSTTIANVTGTASLAGTVQANFTSGNYVAKKYTILSAATVSGTFGGLTTGNLPANFTASLAYDTAHAYLDLALSFVPPTAPGYVPLNVNQINVANALVNYFNATGAIPAAFGTLTAAGLTQVDGEAATGAERGAFDLMDQFLELILDPFVDGRSGAGWPAGGGQAMSFAPDEGTILPPDVALAYNSVLRAPKSGNIAPPPWTAWGAGFGGSNTTNGDPVVGSNTVTASDYGYAAGMDYHFSPDTVAGFALAGGGTNWNLAQGLGSGRSDAFQAGVYGVTRSGPFYLAGAFAFADNWMSTNRIVLGDQLTASFNAQSYGGRVEAGYRYAVPVNKTLIGVTPYAALQAQSFHTPSYSETDLTGGGFGLSYSSMNATDTRSELGARFDEPTLLGGMPLVLRSRVAWAHDWVSNPSLAAVFESLPGASFIVNGATPPKDSALASAGAVLHMTANWSFAAKFDGEFANNSQTYAGSGTLRYSW
jgi:uncharacterized protein with beta-barrel porin domain